LSDYRAVAAMTETLRNMLQDAVHDEFPGARVETNRPQRDPPDPRHGLINVFLYMVDHNPNWRNMELPVRAADGTLLQTPRVALDLHYLVSFYGSDERQIPQLLLGKTVATLHKWPHPLPRYLPRRPPDGEEAPVERHLQVWDSGLLEQIEQLRFVPLPLSHDELSKLWTIFFQMPYVLSVAYRCSVLLIEPEMDEVPQPSLPVREVRLADVSTELPEVDQVVPQVIEERSGARLLLRGRNLDGVTAVEVGGKSANLRSATSSTLLVDLPAGLAAGAVTVQAFRDITLGNPPVPHRIYGSNPASVVLRPRLTEPPRVDAAAGAVAVRLAPPVVPGQTAALLLNQVDRGDGRPPASYSLPADAPAAGERLRFATGGVDAGSYLLRVAVDGVSTSLEVDTDPRSPTFDQYVAPRVTLP
jgi:hypothetical protein